MRTRISRITVLFSVVTIIMGLVYSAKVFAAPPKPVKHEIIVSKDGDGDFTNIRDAVASITNSSATNPFLITVKPGYYEDYVILDKPYVSIKGKDKHSTILKIYLIVQNTTNFSIEDLTLEYYQGSGTISIGVVDDVAISNCIFTGDGISIHIGNDNSNSVEIKNSDIKGSIELVLFDLSSCKIISSKINGSFLLPVGGNSCNILYSYDGNFNPIPNQ